MKPFLIAAALLPMACAPMATTPAPAPEIAMPEQPCSTEQAQGLIGQPGTAELATDALRRTGAKTVRWIRPGMAVTMDFRSDRLNIELDDANRVTRLSCG